MSCKMVAILSGPATLLDHLGVLASLLEIPLIVTEEKTYALAKQFYPQLDVSLKDSITLSPDFLAENFELILHSGKFWTAQFLPLYQLLGHNHVRFAYCPHGNSDKGHSLKTHVEQDIALIYGDHMRDLLKRTGALDKTKATARTGNYRYRFYREHRKFYDTCLPALDRKKKTILYAPTWQDQETPTSFFQACSSVVEQLAPSYNLIIKLHPLLEQYHPGQTHSLLGKYENQPGVIFLTDFPPIYPLLSVADAYLGDFSSIGYDFLAFDKPMFFFNLTQESHIGVFLHQCGVQIKTVNNLLALIQSHWNQEPLSALRKQIYHYAFGEERDPRELKKDLQLIYQSSYEQR